MKRSLLEPPRSRKRPIAAQLADKLGGTWFAVRDGFCWHYVSADGRTVRPYSQLTPQYDGDDETCMTVYIDDQGNYVGCGGMVTDERS